MLPHTANSLRIAVLKDLRVGQSSADSTAGRLRIDRTTAERICDHLVADKLAETTLIADRILVYRITTKGLEAIL